VRTLCATFLTLLAWRTSFAAPPDPAALADRLDRHLETCWAAEKIKPSDLASDAVFARRLYLDLVGRIPTVAEVRAFLEDKSANKRGALITRLVDSPAHARHAARFWRREWVPQIDTPALASLAEEFEGWLASKFREGTPYDRLARELLTATSPRTGRKAPTTFLIASEYKPENLAANTTRAFLGINLDCAQCHDHPFARWTRDQFWETAAFFARPEKGSVPAKFVVTIPNTKRTAAARLLNDREPKWPEAVRDDTGRTVLAEWVTAKDNPYFARNAVNRLWADLFGTGLVEPLDDLSGQNPPAHPELLDELAKAFADSGFDLKYLTTAIAMTKAYQRSAVAPTGGSDDPRLFARAAVRGMTGDQLYESLRVAAGLPPDREDLDPVSVARERKEFVDKFRVERTGAAQRSILQALSLMNGKFTATLTDLTQAPTLRAAEAPFLDTKGKVEVLYLAALGRKPSADELARFAKYVEKGGADGDARKALADVFWALLNSSEFNTNH
jgi:hypothetical protein